METCFNLDPKDKSFADKRLVQNGPSTTVRGQTKGVRKSHF